MKVYDGSQAEQVDEAEPERVKVGIAEYDVTTDGAVLTTSGLGSCIGLALFDGQAGVAGLVHVMLPSADEVNGGNPAKFADTGTEQLVEAMVDVGGDPERMEAKIAGGSDMLDFSEGSASIGDRNAEMVETTLAAFDIPVVAEDTGGDHGRSLKLEGATGDLVVKSANRDELRL